MKDYKCVCRIYNSIEKTFTEKIITWDGDTSLINDWFIGKVTCSSMPGWNIKVHFPLDSTWKLLSYHSSDDVNEGLVIRVCNKLEQSAVCRIHLKQMDSMFGKLFQLFIDNTTVQSLMTVNNTPFRITFETSNVPLKLIKELNRIKYELLAHVGIFTDYLNQYDVVDCTDDDWSRNEYIEDEDVTCYQGSELFAVDRYGACPGAHVIVFFDLEKEYSTNKEESDV